MRRTKAQILRDRKREWDALFWNGWHVNTACSLCGNIVYCRGKRRDKVKCEECFLGAT